MNLIVTASENGYQEQKIDELVKESDEQNVESSHSEEAQPQSEEVQPHSEEAQLPSEEGTKKETSEQPSADNGDTGETQQLSVENVEESVLDKAEAPSKEETQPPSVEDYAQQGDDSYGQEQQSTSADQTVTRRMEVPNNKVCWLIFLFRKKKEE